MILFVKKDCAMHKKFLHCSKACEKICLTERGFTQQRIQAVLLIDVSSTLLLWSGFKRNLIQVALFYARARREDGTPGGVCLRQKREV